MPWRSTPDIAVRALEAGDVQAALALCAQDPVASVLAAARLEELGVSAPFRGQAWGAFREGEMTSLAWVGANIVPVSPSGVGLEAIARHALRYGRRFSSVVGDAPAVHTVWSHLARAWPSPRQVRADQPSLAIQESSWIAPDPSVRRARLDELELVMPASVAMFTEEYGYSPLGSGGAYGARVRQLVELGRCFVRIDEGPTGPRVVFKAEIGAFALGVAQLQGVWVHPDYRGQGLGKSGTSAVVDHALSAGASTVSLYVNDYNTTARRTYRRVGFAQVGSYATIVC